MDPTTAEVPNTAPEDQPKGGDILFVDPWTPPPPHTCPRHGPAPSGCGSLLDGLPDDNCTAKLAFTLGICKIVCGLIIVFLGMGALLLQASLAGIGAGMWGGMTVLLAGVIGILSSRLPNNYGILVAFLCWSITSLATSALVIIFSATGLVRDLHVPPHDAHLEQGGNGTLAGGDPVTLGSDLLFHAVFPGGLRPPAIVLNAALVTMAMVDCLMSVACIALVCSEACAGSGAPKEAGWGGRAERKIRQDRLRSWIDQQQIGFFWPHCANTKPIFIGGHIGPNSLPKCLDGTPCMSQDQSTLTMRSTNNDNVVTESPTSHSRIRY